MIRYLLDTNIVSFLIKGSFPALDRKIRSVSKQNLAISTVCEAELRLGLQRFPAQAETRKFTEEFLDNITILAWDSRCAEHFAVMMTIQRRLGKPLTAMDSMIAAHALAEDCVLVTNDQAFLHVEGLRVEDWTRGPQAA